MFEPGLQGNGSNLRRLILHRHRTLREELITSANVHIRLLLEFLIKHWWYRRNWISGVNDAEQVCALVFGIATVMCVDFVGERKETDARRTKGVHVPEVISLEIWMRLIVLQAQELPEREGGIGAAKRVALICPLVSGNEED